MDKRRRATARIAILLALIAAPLAQTGPSLAASRDEAGQAASTFLSRFLEGDDRAASQYTSGDPGEWRAVLEKHLPGPGEYTGYSIVSVKGSSRSRTAIVRIQREDAADLFYLDFDDRGRIASFYTIDEALAPLIEELRRVTGRISGLELTADSYAELEELMAEQQRVASDIKSLLWRYRQKIGND